MDKEILNKKLDEKISLFVEKTNKLKEIFNEIVLDRKEILTLIDIMEKEGFISDAEKISAIRVKLEDIDV